MVTRCRQHLLVSVIGSALLMPLSQVSATDLRGRVDSQNAFSSIPAPANSIRVQLLSAAGNPVNEYRTGPDGMYYFRGVAPGNYRLHVDGRTYAVVVQAQAAQDIAPIRIKR